MPTFQYCTRGFYALGIRCFDDGQISAAAKPYYDAYLVLVIAICTNAAVFVYCAISSSYRAVAVDTGKFVLQLITCNRLKFVENRIAPVEEDKKEESEPPQVQELEETAM